uniref:Craniofacial development protein 1 n=1 Tax=Macrostomum lignano TaxID=282301 RepID=A0A1I8F970_9PLAT
DTGRPRKSATATQATKIFEFAGESVAVQSLLRRRAVQRSARQPPPPKARPKLSTLEKSRLDWESFKSSEGIGEDLAAYNRGKSGYLDRQAFLERADYRRYEQERDARLASGRGGQQGGQTTMTSAYLKNLMGVPVTDEELENIPHPNVELTLHTTVRFIQPPWSRQSAPPDPVGSRRSGLFANGVTGARVGAVAAPLVTYAAMRKEPEIAVYDRVYRLRYHSNQVRHDRYFLIGASIGGASNGPAGALVGILGGIALATAYKQPAG